MCGNECVSRCDHRAQSRNDIGQCFLAYACCELRSLPAFHHVGPESHGVGDSVVKRMLTAAQSARNFDA